MAYHYTSFISEHTAEYIMIPKFKSILKKSYSIIVPIYPWLKREFGALSTNIHANDTFKVVGLYPRRPKLISKSGNFMVKVNPDLIDCSEEALSNNIPMIAGCPLATNFKELNENTIYFRAKLSNSTSFFYEIKFGENRKIL